MNTLQPECTVVIPVYNGARYIGAALDSVLSQTFEGWRAIVVEDGSTDNTRDIVEAYIQRDSRIEMVKTGGKGGVANARNLGVQRAQTEWIAFLDSDDIWMKEKLEAQLARVRERDCALCFTGAVFMGPEGEPGRTEQVPESVDYEQLLYGNVIITSSALVKREAMLTCPMERDDLHEDFIAWLRILKRYGAAVGLNKPMIAYRLTPGSKSRNKLASARMAWNTYRYMGLSLPKTLKAFSGYIRHGIRRYF